MFESLVKLMIGQLRHAVYIALPSTSTCQLLITAACVLECHPHNFQTLGLPSLLSIHCSPVKLVALGCLAWCEPGGKALLLL